MREKFERQLAEVFPLLNQQKLLLAVSGGIDSMVMADLFRQPDFNISIAHCNFNLRGSESDGDEDFVKSFALKNQIAVFTQQFDTNAFADDNKLSVQVAARQLRYAWFDELVRLHGFDFVLTAHHADDNLETFLINFCRGTGLEGLTGIPLQNGKIIRPMLAFSRQEIEDYATKNGLEWREDSSNSSDKYLRNKIRHEISPRLKALNPAFMDSLSKTFTHLKQARSLAEDAANLVYKQVAIEKENRVIFKIFELKRLPNYRAYLYEWLNGFGFTAWDDIYALCDAQSGKQVFSPGFRLLKDREILILSANDRQAESRPVFIEKGTDEIHTPINLTFCEAGSIGQADENRIFVDADKLQYPLELRRWREGDYFYPLGMTGKKKIAKYFKDEKIPLIEKSNAWILCSRGETVWIVGRRIDDRFKIDQTTKHILEINAL